MKFLVSFCFVSIVLVLGFSIAAPCSYAQAGGEFMHGSAYGSFKGEDLKLMKQAISKAQESGAIDEPQLWSNPSSGAKGSVTVIERTSENGRPCARLQMVNEAPGKEKGTSKFLWCRLDNGEWKILR